jgi:hypothetical protein
VTWFQSTCYANFDTPRCSKLAHNISLLLELEPGAKIAIDVGTMCYLGDQLPKAVVEELENARRLSLVLATVFCVTNALRFVRMFY